MTATAEKTGFMPKDDEYNDNHYRTATLAFMRASESKEGAFAGSAMATFDEEEHKFSLTKGFPIGIVPIGDDGEDEQFTLFFGPKKAAVLVRTVAKTGTVMLQGVTTEPVEVVVQEEDQPEKGARVPTNVRVVAYKARKGTPFAKSGGQWTLSAEWGHSDGTPGGNNLAQFGLAGEDLPY